MLHNMHCIALSRIFTARLQVLTHEFSGTKKLTFKSFCLQNLVLQLSVVFIFILSLFRCRYSTPLHDAVACGRQEIAKILIERGANVRKFT